jgi:hypothetical protein
MPKINSLTPKPIDVVKDDIEFLKVRIRSLEIEIKNINKNITKMIKPEVCDANDNIGCEDNEIKEQSKSWFW